MAMVLAAGDILDRVVALLAGGIDVLIALRVNVQRAGPGAPPRLAQSSPTILFLGPVPGC